MPFFIPSNFWAILEDTKNPVPILKVLRKLRKEPMISGELGHKDE
jgi:hypothetical protein